MFKELEIVELAEDVTDVCSYGTRPEAVTLPQGKRGTVVTVFTKPSEAYEVEFVGEDGDTLAIFTLKPNQILRATP